MFLVKFKPFNKINKKAVLKKNIFFFKKKLKLGYGFKKNIIPVIFFSKQVLYLQKQTVIIQQSVKLTFKLSLSFFGVLFNTCFFNNFIFKKLLLGSYYFLSQLNINYIISNFKNFCILFGTRAFILSFKYRKSLCNLLLPSKKVILVKTNFLVLLGRNDCVFINHQQKKLFKHGPQKITVRGIAKNPVDHPNGGRSNTKQPLKTPWGLIAKHNK